MRTLPLGEASPRSIRALLAEESEHWAEELAWDYSEVSSAVASGLERGTLAGSVATDGLRALGYCYYMQDTGRAVVGSVFAREGCRGQGLERLLLETVLSDAQRQVASTRVECQTLFSTDPSADDAFTNAGFASRARAYMVRPLAAPVPVPPVAFQVRSLRREDFPAAADVIHRSHRGSLDAALNLTYSSTGLCRTFVETLVLRSGCGRYDPDASLMAFDRTRAVGVLLASRLSSSNGHICQVSVAPEAQGHGLGGALVGTCLLAFRRAGLSLASLSVTVDNTRAFGLYDHLGFRTRKHFGAHAWVRPPRRIVFAPHAADEA